MTINLHDEHEARAVLAYMLRSEGGLTDAEAARISDAVSPRSLATLHARTRYEGCACLCYQAGVDVCYDVGCNGACPCYDAGVHSKPAGY